jgi:chemotaxis protein CheX
MMDAAEVVDAIRSVTGEVFTTMLGIDVEAGEHFTERTSPGPSDGVISVIGLAGQWVGTGSICCSPQAACAVASAMLATEYAEVSDDVLDAMSELTNMIIGNFKTAAESKLGPLGLSIPTVIYGCNFTARSAGKETWTVVPFRFAGHDLVVKICLAPNRGLTQFTLALPGHSMGHR